MGPEWFLEQNSLWVMWEMQFLEAHQCVLGTKVPEYYKFLLKDGFPSANNKLLDIMADEQPEEGQETREKFSFPESYKQNVYGFSVEMRPAGSWVEGLLAGSFGKS